MTDSEMRKVFAYLSSGENNLNEIEMAISMLVAVEIAKEQEISKSKVIFSER